jgi:hypothetical protein
VKAERSEEAAKEKYEASQDWLMRFEERILLNKISKVRQQVMQKTCKSTRPASYPEGGYTKCSLV